MKRALFIVFAMTACKTSPVVCKAPRFDPTATCETVEKNFYADMADACSEAQPALAEALRAVARNELLQAPPEGSSAWTANDRRSFTLYQASWKLLPAECTTDFDAKNYPVDDYGRSVSEVTGTWQTSPRCRPDEEARGSIDIGVWSFATVLTPHLDRAGKAYLHKLLVCEER